MTGQLFFPFFTHHPRFSRWRRVAHINSICGFARSRFLSPSLSGLFRFHHQGIGASLTDQRRGVLQRVWGPILPPTPNIFVEHLVFRSLSIVMARHSSEGSGSVIHSYKLGSFGDFLCLWFIIKAMLDIS